MPQGITGSKMEKACDLCHITLNKNAVVGDVSAMAPGGIRIGAPAMTSRGLKEADFENIAEFLHQVLEVCKETQQKHGKLLKDFTKCASPQCSGLPSNMQYNKEAASFDVSCGYMSISSNQFKSIGDASQFKLMRTRSNHWRQKDQGERNHAHEDAMLTDIVCMSGCICKLHKSCQLLDQVELVQGHRSEQGDCRHQAGGGGIWQQLPNARLPY